MSLFEEKLGKQERVGFWGDAFREMLCSLALNSGREEGGGSVGLNWFEKTVNAYERKK